MLWLNDRISGWLTQKAALEACAVARKAIMDECFDGGDSGHVNEYDKNIKMAKQCEDLINNAKESRYMLNKVSGR